MSHMKNIAGQHFGCWEVVEYVGNKRWLCRCKCGTIRTVYGKALRTGSSGSCGCDSARRIGEKNTTHGCTGKRVFRIWQGMLTRCHNANDHSYERYGGRGVAVCERWRDSFQDFLADMGEPPTPGHSIERIDGSGNYEPGNCCWATSQEQARNRRSSLVIEHGCIVQTASEWDEANGFYPGTVSRRLSRGWSIADAVTTPINPRLARVQVKVLRSELKGKDKP